MRSIFIILLAVITTEAFAEGPSIKSNFIYSNSRQSFSDFLTRQVGIRRESLEDPEFKNKLLDNNHITDLDSIIELDQRLYIELPFNYILSLPQKEIAEAPADLIIMDTAISKSKDPFKKVWTLSSFITTSIGTFNDTAGVVSAEANQNSPYTLGLSTGLSLSPAWSYSGSIYYSTLVSTSQNLSSTDVSIPPEFGLTSYLSYRPKSFPLDAYFGIDLERFSTFNTDELLLDVPLATREHIVGFGTLGVSKGFSLFGKGAVIKFSISQSLLTKSSRESLVTNLEYSGQKFILFFARNFFKNWSGHFLFKKHFLDGPSKLDITRYGVGIGYRFF